jgi:hypothetical protein
MKLSTYSIILTFIAVLYGLPLMFMPAKFLGHYGLVVNDPTIFMSRFFGSAMFCNGILFWLHRNVSAGDKSWSALLISSVIFNVINLVIGFRAVTGGFVNSTGWSTVVLSALFALASAYFAFKKYPAK